MKFFTDCSNITGVRAINTKEEAYEYVSVLAGWIFLIAVVIFAGCFASRNAEIEKDNARAKQIMREYLKYPPDIGLTATQLASEICYGHYRENNKHNEGIVIRKDSK